MKRIGAILLALVLAMVPMLQTVEVNAATYIYFGFENTTMTTTDSASSFDINYVVGENVGFTQFNLINIDVYMPNYGFTVNSIKPGKLLTDAGVTTLEIGANNSSVSFRSGSPITGNGQLLIFNVTPTKTGSATFKLGPQTIAGVGGAKAKPYESTLVVQGNVSSSYMVSYDANGGSGAPDSQTKTAGSALTLSSVMPTRTGYIFMGWSENKDDTSVTYTANGTFSKDVTTTLYAVWNPIKYTIDYDANSGTGAPNREEKAHGIDYTISGAVPTRSGYTFVGWSTTRNGQVEYRSGETYKGDSNVVFYAVWSEKTLKITYDLNGGSGSIDKTIGIYNSDVKLTTIIPTREGYDFTGWAKSKEGQAAYQAGDIYKVSNLDVTLYATWALKQYEIKFDANEGQDAPAAVIKTHSAGIILPAQIPTREGYDFQGWATASDSKEVKYAAGAGYVAEGDATLYAVWTLKVYDVKFDPNGGSPVLSTIRKTHGTDIKIPSDTLNRTGYQFKGWSKVQGASEVDYKAGDTYKEEGNVVLYAVWQRTTYTIKLDANGGTFGPKGITSLTKHRGVTLDMREAFADDSSLPTRKGYFLIGWSNKKDAVDPTYVIAGDQLYKSDADVTLYAVWIKNPFPDMQTSKWHDRYIGYIYYRGAMTGKSTGLFDPKGNFTRGQLVTILYRITGSPKVDKKQSPFPDVKYDPKKTTQEFYHEPVIWAKQAGIIGGKKNGTFAPNDPIKRQDFMKVLYDYARLVLKKDVSVKDEEAYLECEDAKTVTSYATQFVNWGYVNGFIGSGSPLKPLDTATRATAATIISRYMIMFEL